MTWSIERLQQLMCGVRGHDSVLQFERDRIALRCLNCGHQTAGWQIGSGHTTDAHTRSTVAARSTSVRWHDHASHRAA